jgi:hypothetical protein
LFILDESPHMADLYLKALESERKRLWAVCRLRDLAEGTAERLRISEVNSLIREHKEKLTGLS